jgi:hypothetical protein
VWDTLAAKYSFVTAINILGATQIAGGYPGVTIGHPDLTKVELMQPLLLMANI